MPDNRPAPVQRATPLDSLKTDVQTLDAKITLLAEKIRTLERTQEALGRTLVSVSDRVKKAEAGAGAARAGGTDVGGVSEKLNDIEKKMVTREEIKELRYVLEAMNPLDYATIGQVKDLIDERVRELKKGE